MKDKTIKMLSAIKYVCENKDFILEKYNAGVQSAKNLITSHEMLRAFYEPCAETFFLCSLEDFKNEYIRKEHKKK